MCRSLLRPAVFSSDRHADSRRGQRYHCEVERHRYIREVYGHGEQWSGCEAESRCGRHKYLDHNEYCGKYRGHGNPEAKWTRRVEQVCGVSATQTIVEYATFAILHLIGVPSQISNGIAVVCSATYNFVMNRNVTFKSSSNFTRSVALFVLL